jgi:hypothetical protein
VVVGLAVVRGQEAGGALRAEVESALAAAVEPEIRGGRGVGEHRAAGLCSSAPLALPRHGMVFRGGTPGTYKVYLDNLRLRHVDGTTTPIWSGRDDTRARAIEDSAAFKNVRVRSVPRPQWGTSP